MTWKIHHAWWTHLPGAACIVISAAALATTNAPDRVPIHFGWNGQADNWGPIWELWIALVGVPFGLLVGSFVIDESFVRHEQHRQFNWLAIIDDALLGFLSGMTLATIPQLSAPNPVLKDFWGLALGFSVVAGALAAVLERLRPMCPLEQSVPVIEPAHLSALDLATVHSGRRWQYWETQNPVYIRVLVPLLVVVLLIAAIASFPEVPWLLPVFVVSILMILSTYGGIRVIVTSKTLTVRLGLIGLRLLKIRHADIASVEVTTFSPLADFGGWGIRYSLNKRMWGYFFSGAHGVLVTTVRGKRYLIGSNNSEYLAAVCEAVRKVGDTE